MLSILMVTSILAARPCYFLRSINFFMQPSGRHADHDETHLRLHDSTRALPEDRNARPMQRRSLYKEDEALICTNHRSETIWRRVVQPW
jgi:hypothetical protein